MKQVSLTKALLFCGPAAALIFVAVDVLAALSWPTYSYTAQAVSELSAIGAPTRSLVVTAGLVFVLLLIAFAAGVWLSAGANRPVRMAAISIAAWGAVNLPGSLFSMRTRGTGNLTADAGHLILTGVTVLLILLSIGFASGTAGRRFRLYSIATIAAIVLFGALSATQAPAVAAGEPTPGLGLLERVSVYLPLLWLLVFAAARWRRLAMT